MPSAREQLESYVPAWLASLVLGVADGDDPVGLPFRAAALATDISEFTRLTQELLDRFGNDGVDDLTRTLNACFGRIIDVAHAHGGEVSSFAGDAITILFPATEDVGEDLTTATHRAVVCGLAMHDAARAFSEAEHIPLALHTGVGAGEALAVRLGGHDDRWEVVVAGDPVEQLAGAVGRAAPGEVVLSPEAIELLGERVMLRELRDGKAAVASLRTPIEPRPPPDAMVPKLDEHILRQAVPSLVIERVDAGMSEWLAEMRTLSAMFVGIEGADPTEPAGLRRLHNAVRATQGQLERFSGVLDKLSVDDKGVSLVAAFGLPTAGAIYRVDYAVECAAAIREALEALGLRASIGVTTSKVFCGPLGSERRREYTMIGATVNLAARFMQHADGRVLIDAASRRSCGDRIAFEEAEYVSLKGFKGLVEVYEVLEVHSAAKADTVIADSEMVGRVGEMDRLETALDRVLDGAGGAAVVEGEAGIGKSRIVAALRAAAATRGITWRFGITDAMSQNTPYYAWRGVFEGIFEIADIEDPAEREERVLAHLGDDDELVRRAPLLNAIVQTTFPETEHTRQLTGQARADNTRSLLVALLRRASDAAPTIVVLEDAHWMDSASWSLAAQATLLAPSLLLVLATRPLPDPPPADYERFLRATGDDHLVLGGLPREGIEHIVADRLGAASIPAVVVDWIHERAQGNPFFSQELAYALELEGLLRVDNGEVQQAPTRAQLEAFPLPPTVEGTLLFRIDRLTLPQQFVLKTASALGLVFPVDAVRAAFPMDEERGRLDKHLEALRRADLCQPVISGDDAVLTFKHRYTQEVAYSTMLRDQRAGIHRAVAGWYEAQEAENLEPFYPLLAHHWGHGQVDDKTVHYLERAGEQALRSGADLEAAGFFRKAIGLAIDRKLPDSIVSPSRMSRWRRQLSDASFGLGDMNEVASHATNSLVLVGQQVPQSLPTWVGRWVFELCRQAAHIVLPRAMYRASQGQVQGLLEGSRAAGRLSEAMYFINEPIGMVASALMAVNLAERTENLEPVNQAYGMLGMVFGMSRLHPLAHRYLRTAREISTRADDGHQLAVAWFYDGMYRSCFGDWDGAQRAADEGLVLLRRLGINLEQGFMLTMLAVNAHYQGQFGTSRGHLRLLHDIAVGNGMAQQEGWCSYITGEVGNATGEFELAEESGVRARVLTEQLNDTLGIIIAEGVVAVARERMGRHDEALAMADQCLEHIRGVLPTSWGAIEGYAGPVEVYLCAWERRVAAGQTPGDLPTKTREALRHLAIYAAFFPIAQPRRAVLLGRWLAVRGKKSAARRKLVSAIKKAEKLGMAFDAAQGRYYLARLDADRDALQRAADRFDALGSPWFAAQARA